MPVDKFLSIPKFLKERLSKIFFAVLFAGLILYSLLGSAPEQFPQNDMVVIPDGVSVKTAGEILESRKIIRSPSIFAFITSVFGDNSIRSGGYLFDKKQNVFTVSSRLRNGEHNLETIRVTFPEGLSVKEMAKLCAETLPFCKEDEFIKLAQKDEGYLFPDTYFFLQSATTDEVVRVMRQTFNQKLMTIDKEIRLFGEPIESVITMASILEKEAGNFEDRQNVSSILWKRINLDMALQVDATLDYALNKNTYELTMKDLATTSPFNTYKYKGLPPAPITNPGIESIRAAITPKPTKYLYYLTDRNGRFYFAETYEKHLVNKGKYLNSF